MSAAFAVPAAPPPSLRDMLDQGLIVGEPRTGGKRFWTTHEFRILRDNYPIGGVAACVPLLPGRTAGSIYQHANQKRLVSPREQRRCGEKRHAWTSNEHIDAAIRRGVAEATGRGDMMRLAQSLNRPRYWVSQRAAKLGCVPPRFKEPPWSPAELEIISEAAHLQPKSLRARLRRAGFNRTDTAIVVKLKRLGADRLDPDHCTGHALAGFLGVDGKTVTDWIAKGWLIAGRRGTARGPEQGGDQHWIRYTHVRHFIITHAAHVDIRKVDKFWFIDLLAGPTS